jgi:hypothetical protein
MGATTLTIWMIMMGYDGWTVAKTWHHLSLRFSAVRVVVMHG